MNRTYKTPSGLRLPVAASLACALLIAACASTPPAPTAQLQAAQQAIATAEKMDAGRYAAGELGEARTKLAAADAAVREEKMEGAARLADESRVAAELAASKTATVKATAVNDEMKRSTGTLIDEMQRTTGDTQ